MPQMRKSAGEKNVPASEPVLTRGELAERMCSVHVSRVAEMPKIELYLDQVLVLVADELAFVRVAGEGPLTGSMVNNYVKQHVVTPPVKKRYGRTQLAELFFVCLFKRVYSLAQLAQVMGMVRASEVDQAALYDEVVAALECALAEQFAVSSDFVAPAVEPRIVPRDASGTEVAPELARLLEAAVVSLAAKVYVEQTLALG